MGTAGATQSDLPARRVVRSTLHVVGSTVKRDASRWIARRLWRLCKPLLDKAFRGAETRHARPRAGLDGHQRFCQPLPVHVGTISSHQWLMSGDGAGQVSGPGRKGGPPAGALTASSQSGGKAKQSSSILPDERREGMDLVKKFGMSLVKPSSDAHLPSDLPCCPNAGYNLGDLSP